MQLKKLLQGSIFAVMAAACAIAVPTVANAAGETAAKTGKLTDAGIQEVKVNGESGSMTIKAASTSPEVLVGVGKVNAKKGTVAVASWSNYEPDSSSKEVTVDLSKLKNVADNYIVITTPGNDISIVKIEATAKATKAKYDAAKGEIAIASGDKVGNGDMKAFTTEDDTGTASLYQVRTDYSNWAKVSDALVKTKNSAKVVDLSLFQEEGAKLVFRLAGKNDKNTLGDSNISDKEAFTWADTGTKAKVYVSGAALPGKEAKVTIAAKAKGPKVAIDYVKGTVKFPKDSEYRVATKTALQKETNGAYVTSPTDAVTAEKILEAANTADSTVSKTLTSFNLEVRTKSEKKGVSKWSTVLIETPADLTPSSNPLLSGDKRTAQKDKGNNWDKNDTTSAKPVGGEGVAVAVMKEDAAADKGVLEITYVEKGKLDTAKLFTKNAVQIKNDGKKTYEIVTGVEDADKAAAAKATKVSPGKTVVLTKLEDNTKVWIRVAGDKKNKVWASKYAQLGVVDYPATVPAAENK